MECPEGTRQIGVERSDRGIDAEVAHRSHARERKEFGDAQPRAPDAQSIEALRGIVTRGRSDGKHRAADDDDDGDEDRDAARTEGECEEDCSRSRSDPSRNRDRRRQRRAADCDRCKARHASDAAAPERNAACDEDEGDEKCGELIGGHEKSGGATVVERPKRCRSMQREHHERRERRRRADGDVRPDHAAHHPGFPCKPDEGEVKDRRHHHHPDNLQTAGRIDAQHRTQGSRSHPCCADRERRRIESRALGEETHERPQRCRDEDGDEHACHARAREDEADRRCRRKCCERRIELHDRKKRTERERRRPQATTSAMAPAIARAPPGAPMRARPALAIDARRSGFPRRRAMARAARSGASGTSARASPRSRP